MKHLRLFAGSVLFVLCACSQQGEGDTCLRSNGDSDCESGLVCVAAEKLVEAEKLGKYKSDRCCPEDRVSNNAHCKLKTGDDGSASGGQGGDTGVGGTSSSTTGTGGAGGETSSTSGGSSAASTASTNGGTAGLGGATTGV